MAVVYTSPFEAVTAIETDDRSPVSVRMARAFLRNANNLHAYVCNPKLIPGQFWRGGLLSANASTAETFMAMWPALPLPQGFSTIRWVVGGRRSAGTAAITVRLYADVIPYRGIESAAGILQVGSVSITSGTHALYEGTTPVPSLDALIADLVFLRLTAQNGDGATRASLLHLDAWLEV